jgi:hypothetical protein
MPKIDKTQFINELSRERIGKIPPKKVITPKTKKKPKHKEEHDES